MSCRGDGPAPVESTADLHSLLAAAHCPHKSKNPSRFVFVLGTDPGAGPAPLQFKIPFIPRCRLLGFRSKTQSNYFHAKLAKFAK
mgnify:CR=1 FL=1